MSSTRAVTYARVSTDDQRCDLQLYEVREYAARMGWEISAEYVDKGVSGTKKDRPALNRLLKDAASKKFDTVLVWKLDRFGRSLAHLIQNLETLDASGVRFIATTQAIDTDNGSPMGRFLLHLFGALAQFERALIVERVRSGVAAAQRRGVHCGRPAKVFRRDEVVRLRSENVSWTKIAALLEVPVGTARAALRKARKDGLSPTKQTLEPIILKDEASGGNGMPDQS